MARIESCQINAGRLTELLNGPRDKPEAPSGQTEAISVSKQTSKQWLQWIESTKSHTESMKTHQFIMIFKKFLEGYINSFEVAFKRTPENY